jgi:propanol-preferring alcohol dehydrogenase
LAIWVCGVPSWFDPPDTHQCAAVQYAVAMGLRVLAIGENLCSPGRDGPRLIFLTDTGETKKQLCLKLGAEKWVDFRESQNLIGDVLAAADGLGPQAAIIVAGDVRILYDCILVNEA